MQDDRRTDGFDAVDLIRDYDFAHRTPRAHDYRAECNAVYLIGTALTGSSPELLPQLLCDAALEICGAESTGISVEMTANDGRKTIVWVAAAGPLAALSGTVMPRDASPCGICLDRNAPQLVSVHQAYYDRLNIRGPLVAQAILIPWHAEGISGAFWAVQHGEGRNFDPEDYVLLKHLADFAAITMRHLQHEASVRNEAGRVASENLTRELAQRVHNPLQATINSLYLASTHPEQASSYVASAIRQIIRISNSVEELLMLHSRPGPHKLGSSHS